MNPNTFIRELASVELPEVFNPYADTCNTYDKSNAASLRRKNLRTYLSALLIQGVDTIWMGRDLGYRGGRRTGIALTDEYHLLDLERVLPNTIFLRATIGDAVAERTAAEIWRALRLISKQPFLWNVFPFHPHESANQLTNRRFTKSELAVVEEINVRLIHGLGIKRIVSIGQDATFYAKRFGVEVESVRHPSYGGVVDFRKGIAKLYCLPENLENSNQEQTCLFSKK